MYIFYTFNLYACLQISWSDIISHCSIWHAMLSHALLTFSPCPLRWSNCMMPRRHGEDDITREPTFPFHAIDVMIMIKDWKNPNWRHFDALTLIWLFMKTFWYLVRNNPDLPSYSRPSQSPKNPEMRFIAAGEQSGLGEWKCWRLKQLFRGALSENIVLFLFFLGNVACFGSGHFMTSPYWYLPSNL